MLSTGKPTVLCGLPWDCSRGFLHVTFSWSPTSIVKVVYNVEVMYQCWQRNYQKPQSKTWENRFCRLHINVVSIRDVGYTFGHHENFVKAMIINVYHNQLSNTHTRHHHYHHLLSIPFCKRSFSFTAPTIWNELPAVIRESDTLDTFKRRLKTHLTSLTTRNV